MVIYNNVSKYLNFNCYLYQYSYINVDVKSIFNDKR